MIDHAKHNRGKGATLRRIARKIAAKIGYYQYYRGIGHTPFAALCKCRGAR